MWKLVKQTHFYAKNFYLKNKKLLKPWKQIVKILI